MSETKDKVEDSRHEAASSDHNKKLNADLPVVSIDSISSRRLLVHVT